MRKLATGVMVVLLLSGCAMTANAAPARNPADFDIDGVKLGMSPQQAMAAAELALHVNAASVHRATMTGARPLFYISTHGVTLSVSFMRDALHGAPTRLAVNHIMYKEDDTPQNEATMRQAAFAKYGPPTESPMSGDYQWCGTAKGFACAVASNGPHLQLGASTLDLSDPRYLSALLRYERQKESVKPSF